MRNFENNFGDQTGGGNTGWESLGDDKFKQRSKEQAEGRYEKMLGSKAMASMRRKVMALAAAAVLAVTVVGGVVAGGCSTHEIMDTNYAERVETIENVESFTLTGGPNLRTDPYVTNDREERPNIIMDSGEDGQTMRVPWQGVVYFYENPYDSNGYWYGFDEEVFAKMLFDNGYISSDEMNKLMTKDKDGVVWINGKYVAVNVEDSGAD